MARFADIQRMEIFLMIPSLRGRDGEVDMEVDKVTYLVTPSPLLTSLGPYLEISCQYATAGINVYNV